MTSSRELVVLDASAIVVLLLDNGADGRWVASRLRGTRMAAPHLLPFEVSSVIRRKFVAKEITEPQGRVALEGFGQLPIELWACVLLTERMWELRNNATGYDASYLALAERIAAPMITADQRLATVPRIRCKVEVIPISE